MRHLFDNTDPKSIGSANPNTIESVIETNGLNGCVRDLKLTIDIEHSWTEDLKISLIAPNNDSVILVEREGGSGNNFRNTTFDDAATRSIVGQKAPFFGNFRPEQNLSKFDHLEPNGLWILRIEDTAAQDGGTLNSWQLELDDGCIERQNSTVMIIDAGGPNSISSEIDITGVGGAVIEAVSVTLNIEHSWDRDLSITLKSPQGSEILLVGREGDNGDNFINTTFDDSADRLITEGSAPFSGRFKPEQPLSELQDQLALGSWTLVVQDQANQDGGKLISWSLDIETKCAEPRIDTDFSIEVRFEGGLTPSQRAVFELAAARWREVILGDLPAVIINGEEIDDLIIFAKGEHIDGQGSILGQAGPTQIRSDSKLPATGVMSFDSADLNQMEANGSLISVIIHEMGHVLGIGTLWETMKLVQGLSGNDPVFTGPAAIREYATLRGSDQLENVPIANTGGPGTRGGHWRETTFANELLTGFLNAGNNPLSRLTIACLQDMGYKVNMDSAETYDLPGMQLLASFRASPHHQCSTTSPKPGIV